MCSVSFAPKMGNIGPLDLSLKQGLAPLCSCHDCYLKVSSGDKAWLLTLFLLLFLFRSFRKCKQEASCKCLAWSPSISCPTDIKYWSCPKLEPPSLLILLPWESSSLRTGNFRTHLPVWTSPIILMLLCIQP